MHQESVDQVMKRMMLLILVLFSFFGSIPIVVGQDAGDPLAALSSTGITFYGEVNTIPAARDLIVIGLEDGVNVTLVPSSLYTNGSDESITVHLNTTSFLVDKTSLVPVSINLSPVAKEGIYKGAIIVTATANGNITTTSLTVTATIKAANPWLDFSQWASVVSIAILIFVGLWFPEVKEISFWGHKILLKKRLLVISFGIIVSLILLWSIRYFDFGGPGTILNALLVTPFDGYAIAFVKDKRTERLEKEKASRAIRDDGIRKDTELIRNLIGELATHCASFTPNFYEEKLYRPFDYTPQLLYHRTGLLARKVWDESCRQGFVADIHTLHLEKYYDFIPLYNRCYAYAMTIDKARNIRTHKETRNEEDFLSSFEEFRETYGELELILFVYLSYIQELYSRMTLSPMKLEFPRITRTLLYKLIEYEILKPYELVGLSRFKIHDLAWELENLEKSTENAFSGGMGKLQRQAWRIRDLKKNPLFADQGDNETLMMKSRRQFEQKVGLKDDYKKRAPELRGDEEKISKGFQEYAKKQTLKDKFKKTHPELKGDEKRFNDEFEKYAKTHMHAHEHEFEVLEAIEEWVRIKFREIIEWWELTADDLERIINDIYAEDEIPHFFRHMQDDFQKTYLKLKESIKRLTFDVIPEMPKDLEIKEYKISIGNLYKNGKPKPDPLRLDLDAHASLETKEKP